MGFVLVFLVSDHKSEVKNEVNNMHIIFIEIITDYVNSLESTGTIKSFCVLNLAIH